MSINHAVFSRAQYLYMTAFMAFALMAAGLRASSILASVFQVPLVQAREATDRIARGDFDVTLTVRSSDELGLLGERINGMARNLQANAEHIRELGTEIEQTQREVVFTMGAIGETRTCTNSCVKLN